MATFKDFEIFLGIDQTGAVTPQGVPRPLPISIIDGRTAKPRVYVQKSIPSLSHASLREVLLSCLPDFQNERVLVCVDSVLGLPQSLRVRPRTLLQKSKDFHFNNKTHGALVAHQFFQQFLRSDSLPERLVERKVGANSVFKLTPYQKNIGCGTYRILRDLAQDTSWFSIWPYDTRTTQFTVAEGYPSYFWKHFLGAPSRNLSFLAKKFRNLKFENIDQADSFVLAWGAMKCAPMMSQTKLDTRKSYEGWILGVPDE